MELTRAAAFLLLLAGMVVVAKHKAVEDITKKQFDAMLQAEDYLVVLWCT